MIGQIIGNYKIEQKLGEGGMGTVYRGVDMMLEREVAVKVLRPELGSNPQILERFRSEAVTLAKLIHQNIVTLYSFMRQGNDFFMVLEFVRGETLDTIMQRSGAMTADRAVPLFCKMLDGIEYAHSFGIVHRDIKPANMILSDTGALKVLDFGIARILGTARMTKAGNVIGTIEYMSPEQVKGQETDARSDLYSLGMMLYEMLTGRVPFESQNEFELMNAQVNQIPTPPRQLVPTIPEEVELAIMRAIAKNPDERFQHAAEFRAVLMTAGLTGAASVTSGHRGVVAPRPSNPAVATPTQPSPSEAAPTIAMSTPTTPMEDALKETRIGSVADISGPQPGAMKETRLGAAGAPAGVMSQAKETRLGGPVGPMPPARAPQAPPQKASFFSKLTPVHYIGAGVAVLVVIGLLVAVPLVFIFAGAKKTSSPGAEKAAQPAQPSQPTVGQEQPPVAPVQPAAGDTGGTTVPAGTTAPAEKPLDLTTIETGINTTGQSKASTKPAARAPARPRSDSGDAARRKRDAALRALDQ